VVSLNNTPSGCLIHGWGGVDAENEIPRTWAIVEDWPYRVKVVHIDLTLRSFRLSVASETFEVRVVEIFFEMVRWRMRSNVLKEAE